MSIARWTDEKLIAAARGMRLPPGYNGEIVRELADRFEMVTKLVAAFKEIESPVSRREP